MNESRVLHEGRANRCQVCSGDPLWRVTRLGDVAVSWACAGDLSVVLIDLQRDFEVTELLVTHYAKGLEWATMHHTLSRIADGDL